jgi:hypothetical protein
MAAKNLTVAETNCTAIRYQEKYIFLQNSKNTTNGFNRNND